jgi:Immunoglobulin I-set domain
VVSVFHGDTLNELIPADQSGPGNYLANVQMDQGETVQVSVDSFFSDGGGAAIALTFLQDPSADAVPSIASSLTATNLSAGDTLTFSVTPAGAHPLHVHWFKDGVLLPQFIGTNLVITNIQAGNAGNYCVTVTNRNGTAKTPAVQVTVSPSSPVLFSVPSTQWVTEGYPLKLEANAKGTAPLEYQWSLNGRPLVGETNRILRRAMATVSLNGQYSVAVSNSLGGTNSSSASVTVLPTPIRYLWSTLAGGPGHSGTTDGRGSAARFWNPSGIARDRDGNLIVADAGAGSVRRVTPNGDVSTIANGFGFPVDVEVEGDGSILVQDQQRQVTYRMFADGMRSSHSGGDWGVALSPDGFVYQLTGNGVQRIETNGLSTVLVRNLNAAVDATFDSSGAIYIAEAEGPTVRKLSNLGSLTVLAGKLGVHTGADGPTDSATFYHPNSVSFDAKGNLFIADEFGPTIRKVDTHGLVTTVGGLYQEIGAADGVGANARFAGPRRVLATPEGVLYVVDTDNHTIRVGTPLPVPFASIEARQFQVIWSKYVDGFVLETAASLSSDAEWRPASGTIIDNGNQWVYRESTSEGPQYFRLRHP